MAGKTAAPQKHDDLDARAAALYLRILALRRALYSVIIDDVPVAKELRADFQTVLIQFEDKLGKFIGVSQRAPAARNTPERRLVGKQGDSEYARDTERFSNDRQTFRAAVTR